MERALVDEYRVTIENVLLALAERSGDPRYDESYDLAVEIAGAAETIRGYETVKERNVERYRARVGELLTELTVH